MWWDGIVKLAEGNYDIVLVSFLPAFLMVLNVSIKKMCGLPWESYGADTAFCGLATLSSLVAAGSWASTVSLLTAIMFVCLHGLLWVGVVHLAARGRAWTQAICGGGLFFSCVSLAIYYARRGL
jgi:hypothetical protein